MAPKNWRKAGGATPLALDLQGPSADLLFGGGTVRDTVSLRLADVLPNPHQPRRFFDEDELRQLAASMREVGQLSPILVKPHPTEPRRYLLVAGERRWRAAKLAELPTVAAHILPEGTDIDQIALIENLQRVNLSPVEEAEGMQRLIDRHDYGQEQVGALLGRSRTEVNTTLTLLRLDPAVRHACVTSHTGLSKALLLEIARMEPSDQPGAWEQAKSGTLTVRGARAVRKSGDDEPTPSPAPAREARSSSARFIAGLPRLQRDLQNGLVALETERPAISRADEQRLKDLRRQLDGCAALIDRILDGL
jgi:ParB family chromosome partitioning protein